MTAVRLEPTPDPVRRAVVGERLREANTSRAEVLQRLEASGERDEQPLEVYAVDGDELVGGLIGTTWATWLHVELLWVDEGRRGAGLGTQILGEAERLAREERGCRHVRLETWDFQAPAFYEKQGYRVVGTVEDHPPGHVDHLMVKDL